MEPLQLIIQHKKFMRRPGVRSRLGTIHKYIIENAREYFEDIHEAALVATKQWWMASTNNVKNREPFNYRNFKATASRFLSYSSLVYNMGPAWLGCIYRNPLLWLPPEDYNHNYEFPEGATSAAFALIKRKKGFRTHNKKSYPT